MSNFTAFAISAILTALICSGLFFWMFVFPQTNYYQKRETKKIQKHWDKYLSERYNDAQLRELDKQFMASADQIFTRVLLPFFEEMRQTYRGAKVITISPSVWGNYNYRISCNLDGYIHNYEYPNQELDSHGVWMAAVKLADKYGIEGKCLEDEYYGTDFYFEKKVA